MFTNANLTNFDAAIRASFPAISASAFSAIQAFYPAQNYASEFKRLAAVVSDLLFNCHGYAMASSSAPAKRYRMLTTIPPGTHAIGTLTLLGYPLATPDLIKRFRRLIMNFVVFGDPNGEDGGIGGGIVLPEFQPDGKGVEISSSDIKVVDLDGDAEVCTWWSKGLYMP